MRPYSISFHTFTTRSSQTDFSFKEVNQYGNGLAICIRDTVSLLVASLPDVVRSWVDGLRIPFRDIGVRFAKLPLNHVWNLPAPLQMHIRVSLLRTIRPSPWSFVRFSITSLVTIRNGKYIFHLFFPFNSYDLSFSAIC